MENDDLINQYFEKTLSAKNQKEFDNLLANDNEFAKEVAFQMNLKKAISLHERANLKQRLQQFEAEKSAKKTFKWQYIAASVAVLLSSFWFLNQSPNSQELYNKYYQTYPNTVAPTLRGTNSKDLTSDAFFEYDSGNYKKSHELFLIIYTKEKKDYALFYGGLSLIELNRHKEALLLLNQFNLSKKNEFTPFIKWYKALSFLKLEQRGKAISLLNDLSKSTNPQQEKAKELLEKLD